MSEPLPTLKQAAFREVAEARRLSFAELEARVSAIPDGPSDRLNHPRWAVLAAGVSMAGVVAGLLPLVLIQWLEPAMWMVRLARAGMWIAIAGSVPFFARTLWVLTLEFVGWKKALVGQSDHDLAAFNELRDWLITFPTNQLEDHHRFAELASRRITAKLALVVGSVERLGMLPVLVALYFLVRDAGDLSLETLGETPAWQALLGLGLVATYAIGVQATRMRLRLELYELMLANALAVKGKESA